MGSTTEIAETGHRSHPALPHPAAADFDLATVLHALSDPVRLQVVAMLAGGEERSCSSFDLPVVKSTCTHHFRVLREAGVVRQRIEGKTKLNALRRADLEARFPGLIDAVLAASERDCPASGRRAPPRSVSEPPPSPPPA